MAPKEDYYDFEPYDCTPGDKWELFKDRFMNYASEQVDDRGWSIADHILDIDEGGGAAGAPPMPAAPAELRKANAARLKRGKRSYGILAKHITDPDHKSHIALTLRFRIDETRVSH